jgi:uncharacterized membrane protein YhaH (DUF805 family)
MRHVLTPLRRYADFSGRSRRREFWSFTLAVMAAEIVLFAAIAWAAFGSEGRMTAAVAIPFVVLLLLGLGLFVPSLALVVRRLHDQGRSGLVLLVAFVPILGALVLLALMCVEGTPGPNRYGPDPKGEAQGEGSPVAGAGSPR